MTNIKKKYGLPHIVSALALIGALCIFFVWENSDFKTLRVPEVKPGEALPGGSATLKKVNLRTFLVPNETLNKEQQMRFWVGHSFFRNPWVVAPASTKARDGLGPLFNARSCIACHDNGGRSLLPKETSHAPVTLLVKLGTRDGDKNLGNIGDPIYGQQLQLRSISRKINKGLAPDSPVELDILAGEGNLTRTCHEVKGQYKDGEQYTLCQPEYLITNLAHGDLDQQTRVSARTGPALIGLGLLESIIEKDILNLQDVDDNNNDGISGKANRVWDNDQRKHRLGRFGLKAGQPSVAHQTGAAFANDIGITNPIYPMEECTSRQTACLKRSLADKKHDPIDIERAIFDEVVLFTQNIAVPPTRNFNSNVFLKGREIFYLSNCNSCHQPSYEVKTKIQLQQAETIWPYSDMLLHDMGQKLADNRGEFLADGQEWRTAPLWGLGLSKSITGQLALLHDGRARNFLEAILWHGGEAEASKQQFLNLTQSERKALVFFLRSI